MLIVFQLMGALLVAIGLYAFVDKWQTIGSVKLTNIYDVVLNLSLVLIIMGGIIFVMSFMGCIGALRENTCLLRFVSLILHTNTRQLYCFLKIVMLFGSTGC
jgi:tetraspanin-33